MAIHKNTPKGLHVPNYGGMCSLWGLMVCAVQTTILWSYVQFT